MNKTARQKPFTGSVPGHTADLEVTQVRTVLLFGLARELVRKELYRTHRRDEIIYVVLCEVASVDRWSESDPATG